MKLAGILGCCFGCASFLFATYVSVTGGPDFASKRGPGQERVARIAAAQQETPKRAEGGCCAKNKAEKSAETEGCPQHGQKQENGCGAKAAGDKCSHH